jgi:hypothetical protein
MARSVICECGRKFATASVSLAPRLSGERAGERGFRFASRGSTDIFSCATSPPALSAIYSNGGEGAGAVTHLAIAMKQQFYCLPIDFLRSIDFIIEPANPA